MSLRDLGIAAALALILLALFGVLAQDTVYGDGGPMLSVFERDAPERQYWLHVLHFPVGRALGWLGVGATPFATLRAVSIVSGAVAAAFTYLLCRGWGSTRSSAVVGALLLALSPGWIFHSTTIEVHALHAACFALAACAVVFAPWKRPVLATVLSALALPLVSLSHQSGAILGAGLLAMVQVGRTRRGLPPLSWRVMCLVIGPLFLAALVGGYAWGAHLAGSSLAQQVDRNSTLVEVFQSRSGLEPFVALWLAPFVLLLPGLIAASLAGGSGRWKLASIAGTLVPSMVFFTAWGVTERGGYALPGTVVMAAAVALFIDRLALATLPGRARWALVAVHLIAGVAAIRAYEGPAWDDATRVRADVVRGALGERCVLYSLNFRFQPLQSDPTQIHEVNLYPDLWRAEAEGVAPEIFAQEVVDRIEPRLAERGAVIGLDLSYHTAPATARAILAPYMDAVTSVLEERFWVHRIDHPRWPLARVRPRPHSKPVELSRSE